MTCSENRSPVLRTIKPFLRMIWSENLDPFCATAALRVRIMGSTLPVQDGDQGEQPAGGFEIDPHLAFQPFLQCA
jgi:hypothetical protein